MQLLDPIQAVDQSDSQATPIIVCPFSRDEHGKPLISLDLRSSYSFGYLIRRTEELLLRLFSKGLLSGTTHTCLGQEICQMGVVRAMSDPADIVLSNHRNHGHFLTYSGDFFGLVSEIMGRRSGTCCGVGGSQHLAFRGFHSNGVQAGMTAIGSGHGLALKLRGGSAIVTVIVGDGTLGQGLLYESLNLASIWELPLLFVVENNAIAQTTNTEETIGGSIEARGVAFGLKTWRTTDEKPNFLSEVESIVGEVRTSRRPGLLVIDAKRMGPHSKGDDLRSPFELEEIRKRDPLTRLGTLLSDQDRRGIEDEADQFLKGVEEQALQAEESKAEAPPLHIFRTRLPPAAISSTTHQGQTVRASLNATLHELLSESKDVLLLGEDLHDPYGGAFKITAGLSSRFPDRVMSTPISEAGVVGAAIGLAVAGLRPIVEIMFADFVTLAMDQIFNHAVKFPGMFPGVSVPLVIRTPSGGRRGYGPTHSQSPENLLLAVPGLTVVFPSNRHEPGQLLRTAVLDWPYPTVFLEHKLLYGRTIDSAGYRQADADSGDPGSQIFPTLISESKMPDVTLVCYGDAVVLAESVTLRLREEEIDSEIVIPSLLAPLPRRTLLNLLLRRRRIAVLEEAPACSGFGAELALALLEAGYRGRYLRVAPPPVPIPAARSLERSVLPDEDAVMDRVVELFLSKAT
jgi:2-oxoisovalerate dehydrogenase E1 component